MKKKLLLAAILLGIVLCFVVSGVGHSKIHPSFNEGNDLEIFQDARISYIMGNPDGFLLVNFTYDHPELGGLLGLHLEYPEGVDTVGKVLVQVYDTRGVFSGKSGVSLLAQCKKELDYMYYYIDAYVWDMDNDVVAKFYSGKNIPLAYFYQGEYRLWEE